MSDDYEPWDDVPPEAGSATNHRVPEIIPIFGDVDPNSPDNYRIQVERIGADGVPASLGYLPATAGQDTLISSYRQAGTYRLTVVDGSNRPAYPTKRIVIPPDHPGLRSAASPGTGAGASSDLVALVQQLVNPILTRVEQTETRLAEERRELEKLRSDAAQERMGAAQILNDHMAAHQGEVLKALTTTQGAMSEGMMTQFAAVMQAQQQAAQLAMQQQQQAAQQFAASMAAMHAEERQRREDAAIMERKRIEAQVEAERIRAEERERERQASLQAERDRLQRVADMEAARIEAMMERERREAREHRRWAEERANALEEVRAKADPLGAATHLVTAAGTLAAALGVDLKDLASNVIGGGKSGWMDVAKELIGAVKEGAKAATESGLLGGDDEDPDGLINVTLPDGRVVQMTVEQYQQAQASMSQPQRQAAQLPAYQPPIHAQPAPPPVAVGAPIHAQPPIHANPVPVAQPAASPNLPPPPPLGGLDVQQLRTARQAVARLVEHARTQPEASWLGAVTGEIMQTGDVLIRYLRAVGISAAAQEAGADAQLAARIVAAVNDAGVVPADVPR